MKKFNKYTSLLFIASLALTNVVQAQTVQPGAVDSPPKFVTGGKQQPMARPDNQQQVAVLQLVINAEEGVAKKIDLRSTKVINSFAPKVTSRKTEDGWRISVKGKRNISYVINNPLDDIEVENPEGSKSPYSKVRLSGPVEWTLIVPLYKDGKTLNASDIIIQDTKNENIQLKVSLNEKR